MPVSIARRPHTKLTLGMAAGLTVTSLAMASSIANAQAQTDTSGQRIVTITHVDGVDEMGGYSQVTAQVDGLAQTGDSRQAQPGTPGRTPAPTPTSTALANALANTGVRDTRLTGVARLGSASVYDTSVAVSRRAFPTGAKTVYITRADKLSDALSAGSLTDGPVLFVPRRGVAPAAVTAEISRLGARQVIALGGTGAVAHSVLNSAADGRSTTRLAGPDSYATAVAIAKRAFPKGAESVYLAGLKSTRRGQVADSPDAAAGGILTQGPVLPVPSQGRVPRVISEAVKQLGPKKVYALGGNAVVSWSSLSTAAGRLPTSRLAGPDRYATSSAIAEHAFPDGAKVAYLAAGNSIADAVVGGTLTDGPVLFTPPASRAPHPSAMRVAQTLTRLGVTRVGALSPATKLNAAAVKAVVSQAPSVSAGPLPAITPGKPSIPAQPSSPVATPAPSATDTPTVQPSPSAPVEPTPTPTATTAVETCDELIESFRPISLPSPYTISCADTIDKNPNTLGMTRTQTYIDNEQVMEGSITIKRHQSVPMLKVSIAHELAHAFSFAALSRQQRAWFVTELRKVDTAVASADFNDTSSYDHMPAEQWARGQASCAGWPDPYGRPTASCELIEGAIAYGPQEAAS